MRSRQEIEAAYAACIEAENAMGAAELELEVLLDIRDLLMEKRHDP
jgi:hypothetical protein